MRRSASSPPLLALRDRSLSGLVLCCEHAGRALPPGVRAGTAGRRLLAGHWGWDPGAWAVTRMLSRRFGATAVGGPLSRLWVDLNRPPGDPTLCRVQAGGSPVPWNVGLTPEELEHRVLTWHAPYHAEVDRQLLRRLARGVTPFLLAVHTFTPSLDGERRRYDAGVLFRVGLPLARRFARALRREGLRVRLNEPYSGLEGFTYTLDLHALPAGLPALELEVNQALLEPHRCPPDLAEALGRAVDSLLSWLA